MKLKTTAKKPAGKVSGLTVDLAARADALGEQYDASKQAIAKESEILGALNSEIKELGQGRGTENKKRKTVMGKKWEVGVLNSSSYDFDEKKLLAALGAKLVAQMQTVVESRAYSRDQIRALLAAGKIKTSTLKSCLVTKTTTRVFVRSATAKEKVRHEDSENSLF